jgi:hypothetical protein
MIQALKANGLVPGTPEFEEGLRAGREAMTLTRAHCEVWYEDGTHPPVLPPLRETLLHPRHRDPPLGARATASPRPLGRPPQAARPKVNLPSRGFCPPLV